MRGKAQKYADAVLGKELHSKIPRESRNTQFNKMRDFDFVWAAYILKQQEPGNRGV
jgi:hypothetical protein